MYELAINQPRLDMPEILWKAYIDFETEQEETDRARELYRRLLERTQHVKVWLSFAQFELQVEHDDRLEQARHVYEQANKALRQAKEKEERLMLLEAWRDFEREDGSEKSQAQVGELMPRRVKKRRKIEAEDGSDQGWEEYFDYIFPEDEAAKPNLKLLAMAKMWKKKKDVEPEEEEGESGGEGTDSMEAVEDETVENIDADDEEIVNESSSDSEEDEPSNKKPVGGKDDCSDEEGDAKRQKLE